MTDADKAQNYEFDASISAEEREFYLKAYPTPDNVRDRRTHCTTCKMHLGTAPGNVENIKMHPILRVTHCPKCQDFYNCGEFSKGEDGSELYCRWCGQGGEVYCCSNCPFVFCKSCITKNLSRGVVADIEQNENWRCFACAPKILWPLRAVHWALVNYIEKQKKEIEAMNLTEEEKRQEMLKDRSNCCRLAKAKCGNMSDSMDSIDSALSKRSQSSNSATKKKLLNVSPQTPAAKRQKTNNEVVCTPDLMSMLEPDCQLSVTPKPKLPVIRHGTQLKVAQVQQSYTPTPVRSLPPPPLIQLRSPSVQLRPMASNAPVIRRTVVSPRTPSPAGSHSPVYHTINGYRIDLNSAAQQGTYRLPNGKLIQVKRQSAPTGVTNQNAVPSPSNSWQQRTPMQSPVQRVQVQTQAISQQRSLASVQQQQQKQQTPAPPLRYPSGMVGNTVISSFNQNGPQIQMVNGGVNVVNAQATGTGQSVQIRPVMVRHTFPNNAYGVARTQFQDQIFNAMEICQHLTGKIQSLTNSNAYKTAKNYLELKELYIHMSYLLTYAIGRFKGLQDKCLGDMRQLGFGNDADSLESGQLAAGVDYVRYGQLADVELFTSNMNSFQQQIYEYRKSLSANMEHLEDRQPLSPLHDLKGLNDEDDDVEVLPAERARQPQRKTNDWHSTRNFDDDDDDVQEVTMGDESSTMYKDTYADDDGQDFDDTIENEYYGGGGGARSTEDVMRREEESHAYDRKLTRLIQQYPSIWCTRHPDYGNFEVTRKQWRTIASHFTYSADMKMRWKNIRKRYVRIERRMHEGKRFNGYFDKATNFLINRDRPINDWVQVDCGTVDGDNYERKKLDQLEKELHGDDDGGGVKEMRHKSVEDADDPLADLDTNKPMEIKPLDNKIINFVKNNPVLWRKSCDAQFHKIEEQTRKSLWMHLWKSVPYVRCSDLVDRWTQLYEMYKAFRLKTIKSESTFSALELKYSKYLAKLYFLYKIDEEELMNEDRVLIFGDPFDDEREDACSSSTSKLIEQPDDKEFVLALVRAVRHYPAIWDENNPDYHDVLLREESWQEISGILKSYDHKQASDNEDDEIEIVEPKTDTINLDSDEETTTSTSKQVATKNKQQQLQKMNIPAKITPVQSAAPNVPSLVPIESNENTSNDDEMSDFMSAAHTLLASMLEVDIIEGDTEINADGKHSVKKQPRKKTTNKPNPTLLKQKRLLEREKMEELKRNDAKLKMKCVINVTKVDTEYPNFKVKLEEFEKRRKEWREEQAKKAKIAQEEKVNKEALEAVAADNKEQLVDEKITDAAKIEVESNMASENEKETETEKMDCSQTAEKIKENEGLTEKLTESTMLLSDDPKENNEKVEGVASVKEAVENKTIETKNSTEIEEMETEKRENSVEVEKAGKENNFESVEKESNAEESDNKIEPAGKATKINEASEEGKEEESNDEKKMAAEIEEMETEEQENSVQVEKADNENNGESVEKEPNAEESDNKSEPAGKATKINEASEEGEEESTNGNKMAAEIEEMETEEQENSVEVEKADNENNRESVETESNAEESDNKSEPGKVTEINEASEEGKEDDENKITTEAFEHESQETNNFGSENEVDSARQNENEIEEKSLEDLVTETVSETAEQNLEDINSTESSSDYMLIDKAENVKEDDGQIHGTTIAQVEESNGNIVTSIDEQAFEPNNDDDESILEEIKKVLEANTENVNETTSEPLQLQLETNEMSAAGMLSPSSSSHILKGENAPVVCLDTIITDNATTTTETSIFTENCEKMDIDPTTLDLPITKSNELQLDAATATSQTDDVEMATTTIEKDIASNNETIA